MVVVKGAIFKDRGPPFSKSGVFYTEAEAPKGLLDRVQCSFRHNLEAAEQA